MYKFTIISLLNKIKSNTLYFLKKLCVDVHFIKVKRKKKKKKKKVKRKKKKKKNRSQHDNRERKNQRKTKKKSQHVGGGIQCEGYFWKLIP